MAKLNLKKILLIVGWTLTLGSVFILCRQGITRSFFHQDDVVELGVVAVGKWPETLFNLNNEHLNITFWPILYLQWLVFGIFYTPYLFVNILMHVIVLTLIFVITWRLTKSFLWSSLPVWGMVINPNWFTVIWWITGQMFFLTTIFALLCLLVILNIKKQPEIKMNYFWLYLFSVLPGMSWGVGLSWPIWPLLIYGIDFSKRKLNNIGLILLMAQITLTVVYSLLIGTNIAVHTDPKTWLTNPFEILRFVFYGVTKAVFGRWFWPIKDIQIRFLTPFILSSLYLYFGRYRKYVDRNSLFGIIVLFGSYMTFAIPRWKFGIDHAMANYYVYFPLPFVMISLVVLFSKIKMHKYTSAIVLAFFLIHIPMSWIGYEEWARDWVIRPQQTKLYFEELNRVERGNCIENRIIPEYIVPQNIWRIDYMWPIFKKDFDPFCPSQK